MNVASPRAPLGISTHVPFVVAGLPFASSVRTIELLEADSLGSVPSVVYQRVTVPATPPAGELNVLSITDSLLFNISRHVVAGRYWTNAIWVVAAAVPTIDPDVFLVIPTPLSAVWKIRVWSHTYLDLFAPIAEAATVEVKNWAGFNGKSHPIK